MDMDCCAHPADAGAGEDPIAISMWRCMKRMKVVGSGGCRMMVKALSDNGFVLCAADHAPE